MAINADVSGADQSRGTVYYDGPRIVVTSHYIENAQGRYHVRDLLSITRIERDAHHARNMSLIFGAIEVALAAPLAAAYGSPMLLCVGFASAVGLVSALLIDHRRNPRWMALHATHQGRTIALFTSQDHEEYGKVCRAVLRAVEANRRPRP